MVWRSGFEDRFGSEWFEVHFFKCGLGSATVQSLTFFGSLSRFKVWMFGRKYQVLNGSEFFAFDPINLSSLDFPFLYSCFFIFNGTFWLVFLRIYSKIFKSSDFLNKNNKINNKNLFWHISLLRRFLVSKKMASCLR